MFLSFTHGKKPIAFINNGKYDGNVVYIYDKELDKDNENDHENISNKIENKNDARFFLPFFLFILF